MGFVSLLALVFLSFYGGCFASSLGTAWMMRRI
jgi:hypothetical protein